MDDSRRAGILAAARELRGVPFDDPSAFDGKTEVRPKSVDCSGVVRWNSMRIYGEEGRLTNGKSWTIQARTMFDNLRATHAPLPADLALYQSECGSYHVMMITENGGLIGACLQTHEVTEYGGDELRPETYVPTSLRFVGFRSYPLEFPSL